MNKCILTFLLIILTLSLFAQSRSHIKGKVIDSLDKKPIELVTVGITDLRDSSFVSYTSTNKTGEFSLKNMPSERPIAIIISMVGYQTFAKVATLKKEETLDLGTILLNTRNNLLKDVAIIAQRQAIVINKDTTEFNVEAFKVRPNAVVEDLLKKLPGIQVDNDGTITYNGKSVSKLKIDGKEFFGNDPSVASKNLAADLLDKIKIYDDREDDPDHLIDDANVKKIIDLKLKRKFKRSIFGKVYAGGGSRDRFESGGLFNMFKDTLQISVIGVANNLNKTGFSSNDLSKMGGFNRSGNDALYDGSVSVGGRSYGGIEKVISGGFNLNNDYGKRLKMNLIYFYSQSDNIFESSSFGEQFLSRDTLASLSSSAYNRVENKHNASGLIQWNPDTLTSIRYTTKFSFIGNNASSNSTSSRFNDMLALNQSISETSDNGSRTQFQHSFSYHKKLKKKGQSFNIAHNLNINPENNNYFNHFDLTSFTATLNSEELRRLTSNNNKSMSASVDLTYRHPFSKKLSGDITLTGRYSLNGRASLTYDQNMQTGQYDTFLDNQSTDLDRNQRAERIKLGTSYKFNKKVSFDLGLAGEWLQVENQFNKNLSDLHQNYFNLLPSARLQIADYSISYNTTFNLPTIYNLQPITIQSSKLYSFTGNPYLQPSRNHSVSFSFNKYYTKRQLSLFSHAGGTIEENSVVTQKTLNNEGVSSSSPVNKNGKYNFNIGGGLYKRFKKSKNWQLSMNPYVYAYQNKDFFVLNQDEGFQTRWNLSVSQRVSINWKDKIELSPEARISPQITTYTGVGYQNINYTSHSFDTKYTIRWPKRIYWEGNYAYSYNPLVKPGFQKSVHLLNAAVALQLFKKDKGEIKLSCYDILDQNISSYRYVGVNSVSDSQNQILKRYIMLTYLMKFNKTTTR